jgi:integrase/recombinase XerD
MSALSDHASDYLRFRSALGHKLGDAHRLLPRYVAYLDAVGATTVTVETALTWARRSDADPASSVWMRRMTVARGFARHMAGVDPNTEIPPLGLVTFQQRRRAPFIYSEGDIDTLMALAHQTIRTPFRATTVATLIGLLAASGMRVGEALRLERSDVMWDDAVIVVRDSKFGKSRLVPLHTSTVEALAEYAKQRDQRPPPTSPTFFVTTVGTAVSYCDVCHTFRKLVAAGGIGSQAPSPPRIHDIRHTFAVRTLVEWYLAGEDVQAWLPRLTTVLGHREPTSTYWYLSAVPELLWLAAARLEAAEGPLS